jgi:hypothetical protein
MSRKCTPEIDKPISVQFTKLRRQHMLCHLRD